MRLLADLHTHTIASGHAFSTVTEMAAAAADKGLELVAITDHGPGLPGGPHEWHFTNLKAMPHVLCGVRVLKGIEANVTDEAGLDLPEDTLQRLDFVAAGFHPGFGWEEAPPSALTEALVQVIAHPLVDMVSHPGNGRYPVDIPTVAEACARHNVIVELNDFTFAPYGSRKGSEERERAFVVAALEAGAPLAINSDAHYHGDVGSFGNAGRVARELGQNEADFVNRDAATILAHLLARRPRPGIEGGGEA
jgi:putative hydrolase